MKNYSIIRTGDEYVVLANQKSVLKIATRRRALRLVKDAAELLDARPAPQPPQTLAWPSIDRDPSKIP